MTIASLAVRGAVTILFLWCLVRLSGKRGLGDAGPFDLMVALLLGNLAKYLVLGLTSLPEGFVALGLLAWMHIAVRLLTQHSDALQRWVRGDAVVLVRDGRLQRRAAARQRLTIEHIESLLRLNGITRLGDVHELRLEPDGHFSAVRRVLARPPSPGAVTTAGTSVQEEKPWPYAA